MNHLEYYKQNARYKIEGWFSEADAKAFEIMMDLTPQLNTLEIGVHHGLSFIPIVLKTAKDFLSFAVDVFEDQHLNKDCSGKGDRSVFDYNVKEFCPNIENIEVVKMDSMDISSLTFGTNNFSFIHIDGCHLTPYAYSDLCTADLLLDEGGVAAMDDIFHPFWNGPLSSCHQFYDSQRVGLHELYPWAYSKYKLYLVKGETYIKQYQDNMIEEYGYNSKKFEFFGYPTIFID